VDKVSALGWRAAAAALAIGAVVPDESASQGESVILLACIGKIERAAANGGRTVITIFHAE
jgi:hypothetical protein